MQYVSLNFAGFFNVFFLVRRSLIVLGGIIVSFCLGFLSKSEFMM